MSELWERYGEWKDWSEFDSIGHLGRLVMQDGGVNFGQSDGQIYLGVDKSRGT